MGQDFATQPIERTTRAAEGFPRWRWSTAELLKMVDVGLLDANAKVELIGGEIVPMSPKGRKHEVAAEKLHKFWWPKLTPEIWVSAERQFNLDEWTFVDPDLIVLPSHILTYDARGEDALLVVESADSSWEKDVGIKASSYSAYGVRDYWVIDVRNKQTRIHRDPRPEGYATVRDAPATELLVPLLVPQLAVRLADLDLD